MAERTAGYGNLSAAENAVMKMTMKASMLRAAAIIDKISDLDVTDAQTAMLLEGLSLSQVARIDRALLASCHLRAIAASGSKANESPMKYRDLLESLRG